MSDETKVRENLYLVLGCFGRRDDGFVSCSSCENRILNINTHVENYNEILDYLETCRLFDKPAFDYNAIRNIIFNMQGRFDQIASGRRLWSEKEADLYHKFIVNHRMCGIYLKLELVSSELSQNNKEKETDFEEKTIKIEASNKRKVVAAPKVNLKLIRGKR